MPLEAIRALLKSDLDATNQLILEELTSDVPLINQLTHYITSYTGKRVRPLLVLLSAGACSYSGKDHIPLATAIELIHTATLLHDDVVDNAILRRGQETAHSIWGNEASVLVGDFLYSRAFQLITRLQNLPVLGIFSAATNLIAEGEVMQLVNCHQPDITESTYFDVILRKTAKLFEVATLIGATVATELLASREALRTYGLHLGMAYQLIDDALDYSAPAEQTGKNMCNDLSEGKPTLPLIYALSKTASSEKEILRQAIIQGKTTDLPAILKIIESTRALEYTANAAKQHAQQACEALTHLPDSPYRQALHTLADFVVERTN